MPKGRAHAAAQEVAPYALLAELWRDLMSHVDYERWGHYLGRLVRRYQIPTAHLLELACGECSLEPYLSFPKSKLQVHTDLSLAMLQAVPASCARPLAAVDCRNIAFVDNTFDLVLMNYDAFNYLTPEDTPIALLEIRRVLKPGGFFLFDVTTERNSLNNFLDACDVVEEPDRLLVRRSWYEELASIQHNRFDLFCRRGQSWTRQVEHHQQFVYSPEVLRRALEECRFQVVAVHGDFTLGEISATTERIHWVARSL